MSSTSSSDTPSPLRPAAPLLLYKHHTDGTGGQDPSFAIHGDGGAAAPGGGWWHGSGFTCGADAAGQQATAFTDAGVLEPDHDVSLQEERPGGAPPPWLPGAVALMAPADGRPHGASRRLPGAVAVMELRRCWTCRAKGRNELQAWWWPTVTTKVTLVMVDGGDDEPEMETLLKASTYTLGATGSSIVYKVVLVNGAALAVRLIGESGGADKLKDFDTQGTSCLLAACSELPEEHVSRECHKDQGGRWR